MITPVDATTTEAWADLKVLKDALVPDLRGWFEADPHRAEELTFDLADLRVDLSKNLINEDIVAALVRLAEQVDVAGRRDAMFAGERINVTENRSVLHTALRLPRDAELTVDGVPRVINMATAFVTPLAEQFVDHDAAIQIVEVVARLVISNFLAPSSLVDFTDRDSVRQFLVAFTFLTQPNLSTAH